MYAALHPGLQGPVCPSQMGAHFHQTCCALWEVHPCVVWSSELVSSWELNRSKQDRHWADLKPVVQLGIDVIRAVHHQAHHQDKDWAETPPFLYLRSSNSSL